MLFFRKLLALKSFIDHYGILSAGSAQPPGGSINQVVLIIPVLDEKRSLIEECIDYFSQVAASNVKTYFVTSAREGCDPGSSYSIISEKLAASKLSGRLALIHYGRKEGYKGDQVQHCIDTVKGSGDTLFGVYDVDSQPDLNAKTSTLWTRCSA